MHFFFSRRVGFRTFLMTFMKNAIIKKPTVRALCFAAGRAARGVRHRRMHRPRTRVRLIPLLLPKRMQMSTRPTSLACHNAL